MYCGGDGTNVVLKEVSTVGNRMLDRSNGKYSALPRRTKDMPIQSSGSVHRFNCYMFISPQNIRVMGSICEITALESGEIA
jgi:hypothetical protein